MSQGNPPTTVDATLADGVLTLTLNRPDRLNAYTAQMGRELEATFRRADEGDAVRAVVVTGAGRAFCAGATAAASSRRSSNVESRRSPPSTARRWAWA